MWNQPWKLAEGFLIGAGLIATGVLLQFTVGPIDWNVFSFPANIILLAVFLFLIGIAFAFRKKVYAFLFLASYLSAIPALCYAVVLTAVMGLTRQVPRTQSPADFLGQVEKIGVAVIGQSGNLTPADKKLYALRDVTATVDSIPLITSSIMSKKLAAGSHNIVLDVKVGSGAFMKTPEAAEELAREMVKIGKGCGRRVRAVLSNMDVPLGAAVGNSLEVIEAVNILKGADSGDLYEVSVILASQLVSMVRGIAASEAEREVRGAIRSGAAFEKMKEWIASQGGDVRYLDDVSLFPAAAHVKDVLSPSAGFIVSTDAEKIGKASVKLGAGRASKEDTIDHAAGILIRKKTGDRIEVGDAICTLLTNDASALPGAEEEVLSAVGVGEAAPEAGPLIYGIVS